MTKLFHRVKKKVAAAPGSLEFVGPIRQEDIRIELLDYTPDVVNERDAETIEEAFEYRDTDHVSWINIDGLHDTELLKKLGDHFGLHPLVMEDVINVHQRPKVEEYEGYMFVVVRMLYIEDDNHALRSEQMSFVLGPRWLLSFQEVHGDVFENVRERIRAGRGRGRKMGVDYLLYALIDALVDHYFVVLEKLSEHLEQLEDDLHVDPTPRVLQRIHAMKREMIYLRKSVWPMREVLAALQRTESVLIRDEINVFLRDVYDHTIQAIDAIESFRDMLSSLQDLYLSSISNKMNDVMKVLTIIATIFVPLTFVAGIYGMNFDVLPELHWKWSYLVFWMVILAMGGGMLTFFRKRRWL
jgi:magnesium transporter